MNCCDGMAINRLWIIAIYNTSVCLIINDYEDSAVKLGYYSTMLIESQQYICFFFCMCVFDYRFLSILISFHPLRN